MKFTDAQTERIQRMMIRLRVSTVEDLIGRSIENMEKILYISDSKFDELIARNSKTRKEEVYHIRGDGIIV